MSAAEFEADVLHNSSFRDAVVRVAYVGFAVVGEAQPVRNRLGLHEARRTGIDDSWNFRVPNFFASNNALLGENDVGIVRKFNLHIDATRLGGSSHAHNSLSAGSP